MEITANPFSSTAATAAGRVAKDTDCACPDCRPATDGVQLTLWAEDAAPDLTVSSLEPSTRFPFPGTEVTFDVEVKNQGNADAGAFSVNLSSWSEEDRKRIEEGLKAGASAAFTLGPVIMDSGVAMSIQAFADCDREIAESNERNNKRDTVLWNPLPPPQPPQPPLPPIPPHP